MVFVGWTPWVGDFEGVNAGSGVVMLHYQTRVAAIGNKRNLIKSKMLKPPDKVRTRVRFEKRGGRHQPRRPLLLMAALQAPSQERGRLQGRERWDYLCGRSGLQSGTYLVGTTLRGGRFH